MAPHLPPYQGLGTPPTPSPDVPASAVFLGLFLFAAVFHQSLFLKNKLKKAHNFPFSGAMFGFCVIRTVGSALRIGWSYNHTDVGLAIAAQIFVEAGTVILYIINLFFAQRLTRARHPHIGWSKPFKIIMPPLIVVITVISLVMVIVVSVQSFFTFDPTTLRVDRGIQIYVGCWFLFVAFLPIPVTIVMLIIPRRTYIDKFGAGRFRTKVMLLISTSVLITFASAFRVATSLLPPTLLTQATPWYLSRATFYTVNFTIDIFVVLLYLLVRVDRRFYVPDKVTGPGEYSGDVVSEKPPQWPTDNYSFYGDRSTTGSFDDAWSERTYSMLEVDPKSGKYRLSHAARSTRSLTSPEGYSIEKPSLTPERVSNGSRRPTF